MSEFKCGNCHGEICAQGCSRHADKLNTYDWLADLPDNTAACDIVEVQFKPPRKGYFINANHLPLEKGDVVAVEASPGHDIGTVTMTGRLVPLQVKKANLKPGTELKKIYRKARQSDIDKFNEAKKREHETMIESRQIALHLGLKMKIGDVEYQGDGNKAIFYYIADQRVDFRELIKVLADRFHVRIEMKQIGARQEAGRIGGIGPCGRELCCATYDQLHQRQHCRRTFPGHLAQPSETGWAMRKTQVLHELRGGPIHGIAQETPLARDYAPHAGR